MPGETPDMLLAALRIGGPDADAARAALNHDSGIRAGVASLLAASLRPTDTSIARELLTQEIAAHEVAGHGASETLYTLIAAVARYADPDDVLLLWRARQATPETRTGIDVEQLARAGIERVRRWLTTLARGPEPRASEARQALKWLESGVAAGALDDLPGYFAWADERFGLHISGPT
ncbi:MAG: hypothetical protein ACRDHP_00010 [Ktedonobacterales bacterium]